MPSEKPSEKTYQLVEYFHNLPFRIVNITRESIDDGMGNVKDVLEHWHPEIEIAYTFEGHALHYIDAQVHEAKPGRLFLVNSRSIHKILSDKNVSGQHGVIAVVLLVNYDFIKTLIPNIDEMYFLPQMDPEGDEIEQMMMEFATYEEKQARLEKYEDLKLISMIYRLLYLLCTRSLVAKESALPVKNQKNLELLRKVMECVKANYASPLTQQDAAELLCFTKEYFSRFFKKNTGMTFKEYLTRYRLNCARKEIAATQKSMLDVALDNGFPDARGFINSFRKMYGTTPLKYKKSLEHPTKPAKL